MASCEKPTIRNRRLIPQTAAAVAFIVAGHAMAPRAQAANYEVYPGSAFYLPQMLDRSQWPFVAEFCSGLYHHPVGFNDLDATQEATYTGHFTNRFAMVEGDMGSGSTTGEPSALLRMMSPI